MMDAQTRLAYESALARFLEGEPEPEDGELIVRTVREYPELRQQLAGALVMDDLLRQQAELRSAAFVEAFITNTQAMTSGTLFVNQFANTLSERLPFSASRRWLPWGVAAAASVLAMLAWWEVFSPRRAAPAGEPTIVSVAPPATGDSLALLVNEAGARFAAGAGPSAVSFGAGSYALTNGIAHLRFRNGTDLVLVAPTDFTITDALHVQLDRGSLRALVPPSGFGFVVDTAQARYRDLGTEFGVTAGDGGQRSDLHVFAGQVEIYPLGQATPSATLSGGESLRHQHGQAHALAAAHDQDYPTPQSISLARWNLVREDLENDPDLVLYHPFLAVPEHREVLRDHARHGAQVDGTITGATWVAGRWPGKQALQFEQPGDRVALTIPGEFTALTFAAWIKIDRLENAANGLLMSVGWRPGNVQWQLDRRGSPAPSSIFSTPKRQVVWSAGTLPIGRWAHCAVTMDRTSGRLLHYVNGELVGEARVHIPTGTIKPGACLLGAWLADNKTQEDRDFRGRIDELAMWRVVLSAERIARLAQDGMPVELSVTTSAPANHPSTSVGGKP